MAEDTNTIDKDAHDKLVAAHERLKKDAQADRDALKELRQQVADLSTAKEEAEAAAAAKAGDVDSVKAQLEAKHSRELKAVTDRAEKAEARVHKLVGENGLDAALDGVKVSPALKKAAKALLRDGLELRDENGEPVALLNGAPLADAVKAWASTDEGKHFILDGNAGGGAPGGKGSPAGKNPWKADQRNLTEQDRIEAQDPALASRLKAEAGV